MRLGKYTKFNKKDQKRHHEYLLTVTNFAHLSQYREQISDFI